MQIVYVAVIIAAVIYASGRNINNTAPSEINAQYLIDVGVKTNDYKLEAIGTAMKKLHPNQCNEWSTWSKCTTNLINYFGIKDRVRKCVEKFETDSSLCKYRCPSDYVTTESGYCIKIHSSPKLRNEGERQCLLEGGHLVQINSQEKYDDIRKMKLPKTFANFFHIGGRRKDSNSPCTFQDGTSVTFFKWTKNEPDNQSLELCLYMETIPWAMHDALCAQNFPYMCEITKHE